MERIYLDTEFTKFFNHSEDKCGELLQLGAVAARNGAKVSEFNQMCKPVRGTWSEGAERVHGISRAVARVQQDPEVMMNNFVEWMESLGDFYWHITAHYSGGDNSYMTKYLAKYGLLSRFQAIARPVWRDTYKIAAKKKSDGYITPKNLKLGTLCEYFGLKLDNAHDALADCKGCSYIDMMLEQIEEPNKNKQNISFAEKLTKKESIKKFIDMKYIQYGSDGTVYLSKHAVANKDAMQVILTELWDKYC